MNVLPREKRLAVLAALVDGNSIRAVERMTGVHRDTIMRFGIQLGEGCDRLHNRLVRDLSCSLIDVDEQWSFVNTKTSNLEGDAPADGSKGDAWTWIAIDRSSRMVLTYYVGKRDQAAADNFVMDLRARLAVMPSLMTSDGLSLYVTAILTAFGPAAPLAQTVKNYSYGARRTPDHRYAQPHMGPGSFISKRAAIGTPNLDLASTSKAEVNNLLARHKNGRMRRLCLAFSKTLRGHKAAASLFYTHYNFCHVLRTTRLTPALAAGVTDHLWSLEEFMDAVLDETPIAAPIPGPLTFPKPEGNARELPNGRGWLRVVQGSGEPSPSPAPATPPAAPVAPVPAAVPEEPSPQLDLFAWTPKARPVPPAGTQLDLFSD